MLVEGLGGVKVAAVATNSYVLSMATNSYVLSTRLVADEDGEVWGFGARRYLGLDDAPAGPDVLVEQPMPITALRLRVRKSPPVLRLPGAPGVGV